MKTEMTMVCDKCNASGKTLARTMHGDFLMDCSDCNGEKLITEDLIKRKELGKTIRDLAVRFRFTIRQLGEKSGDSLSSWSDAYQGRLPIPVLESRFSFLKELTKHLEIKTEFIVNAVTSLHYENGSCVEIFRSESEEEAKAEYRRNQGKMFHGKIAVYEIQKRQTVIGK